MTHSDTLHDEPWHEIRLEPHKLPQETIAPQGLAQIDEALRATVGLEGDELNRALVEYYAGIKPQGLEAVEGRLADPNVPAVIINYGESTAEITVEQSRREASARLLFLARGLGVAWTRHYEQEGALIQVVHPEKGYENTQSSKGMTALLPHLEILPEDGKEIRNARPKYTALHAIINTPGVPTTLFDTKPAVDHLSSEALAILEQPRFAYLGTDLERLDTDQTEGDTGETRLPILYPIQNEQGKVTGYDVVIDFDTETMKPVDGDHQAEVAWKEFEDLVLAQEVSVIIPEQQTLVWKNGGAYPKLHGRKYPITDPNRELRRVQIGAAEQPPAKAIA